MRVWEGRVLAKNIFHLRFTIYNFRFTVFKQAGKFWKVLDINLRWKEVLEEYFLMTETFWKGHSPEKERPPFGWLWIPQGVHCWIESVIWVESKKTVKWKRFSKHDKNMLSRRDEIIHLKSQKLRWISLNYILLECIDKVLDIQTSVVDVFNSQYGFWLHFKSFKSPLVTFSNSTSLLFVLQSDHTKIWKSIIVIETKKLF